MEVKRNGVAYNTAYNTEGFGADQKAKKAKMQDIGTGMMAAGSAAALAGNAVPGIGTAIGAIVGAILSGAGAAVKGSGGTDDIAKALAKSVVAKNGVTQEDEEAKALAEERQRRENTLGAIGAASSLASGLGSALGGLAGVGQAGVGQATSKLGQASMTGAAKGALAGLG